jgi:hypothetical protein
MSISFAPARCRDWSFRVLSGEGHVHCAVTAVALGGRTKAAGKELSAHVLLGPAPNARSRRAGQHLHGP